MFLHSRSRNRSWSQARRARPHQLDLHRRSAGRGACVGPNHRWLFVARNGNRIVSFRWNSISTLHTAIRAAFPQRNVVSLFAVPDGGLWVGYRYGGVSFIKDGTVTDYGKPEGLPSSAVLAFARDRRGAIWIAAGQDGLARLEGSQLENDRSGLGVRRTCLYRFRGSRRHSLGGDADQCRISRRGRTPVSDRCRRPPADRATARRSARPHVWMAERGYGVRRVPLPGKNNRAKPAVLVGSLAITFDDQGSLWITSLGDRNPSSCQSGASPATEDSEGRLHGRFRQFREVEAFTQENGLTSDLRNSVLQDREGNVWIGTSAGLDRFRQSPVVSVPLQPISTVVSCRSHRCTLLQQARWRRVTKGRFGFRVWGRRCC